jgi:hypothetical protein
MMRALVDVICKRYPKREGVPFGLYSDTCTPQTAARNSLIGVCICVSVWCDIAELTESVERVYLLQSLGQDGRVVGSPARP